MSKVGFFVYRIIHGFSNDPVHYVPFVAWLICATIETVIVSFIIAVIAKLTNSTNSFGEWFKGSAIVVGIIEMIVHFISLF